MKRKTYFAQVTAAICGAFLLLIPATIEADDSFEIFELLMAEADEDFPSDPSIAFDPDDERFFVAYMEYGPVGLLCAIMDFEDGEGPNPFLPHIRKTLVGAGPFVVVGLPVTSAGHSAVRVGSNGNFVASELAPSTTDSTKLDVWPRSGSFTVMSDRIGLSLNGKVLFGAGAGDFGGSSSIHVSTSGTTSTPIIDDSGPFDTFYAPSSNQFFSHYVFPAELDDGTQGFWSLQNNGVATPIIDTKDGYYAGIGSISVNDRGIAAFRTLTKDNIEIISLFRNNKVEDVVNTAGSFRNFNDASINNRNEIAVYALNDDLSGGVQFVPHYFAPPPPPVAGTKSDTPTRADSLSALPSPTPITIIKTGDALSGSTVTNSYVGTQALTDRGEIVFRATLADGREGIYFARPKRSALLNIATRLRVLTGENVLIAGFIVTGTDPKKVIIRGIGPSLGAVGVQGALADPVLELHQGSATLATNNNWKIKDSDGTSQEADIQATTIPPSNDNEAALVATLPPGQYTAILSGMNNGTGIGLVEVYDLDQAANSQAVNISTRGFVDTGDNVMIGGFIAGPANAITSRILIRALGPSLQSAGVAGALANPLLELHDASGATLATNDNWKVNASDGSSQQAEIEATTIPPTNDLESAILASLPPGNYTAIVRGTGNSSGVSLVEFYNLK
jgi:hypothetical protein